MEIAPTKRYPELSSLFTRMFFEEITDNKFRHTVERLTFTNVGQMKKRVTSNVAVDMYRNVPAMSAGELFNLDDKVVEAMANNIAYSADYHRVSGITESFLKDMLNDPFSAGVIELVREGSRLGKSTVYESEVRSLIDSSDLVVFLSVDVVRQLNVRGSMSHPSRPRSMETVLVRILDALSEEGCRVILFQGFDN